MAFPVLISSDVYRSFTGDEPRLVLLYLVITDAGGTL